MRTKHTFQSGKSDGGDTSLVRPSNWNADHLPNLVLDSRTANYTILDTDGGELLRAAHSAAITFTLPAASGLTAGWCIWIENRQTGTGAASQLAITRSGTDTIDGVATIYTYPEDLRIIFRTGSGTFESTIIRGGRCLITNTAGETFYWPSRARIVLAKAISGGGGGGGGAKGDTTAARYGAGGGGGGMTVEWSWAGNYKAASSAITTTPGAGGTSGAGATAAGTAGNYGGEGGTTSLDFGSSEIYRVRGGGGGGRGNSTYDSYGGASGYVVGATASGGVEWAGTGTSNSWVTSYRGASGGAANLSASVGGRSVIGGGGGGGAGHFANGSSVEQGGAAGGGAGNLATNGVWDTGGGGGAGGSGSGGSGSAGAQRSGWSSDGGGGGASGNTVNGGDGGNGSSYGGGGGGGGATHTGTRAGNGGVGGQGAVEWTYA